MTDDAHRSETLAALEMVRLFVVCTAFLATDLNPPRFNLTVILKILRVTTAVIHTIGVNVVMQHILASLFDKCVNRFRGSTLKLDSSRTRSAGPMSLTAHGVVRMSFRVTGAVMTLPV